MTQPNALEHALLETLAYSDVFEYPLRLEEVHRYLPLRATLEQVRAGLGRAALVDCRGGYYFLTGQGDNVDIRLQRASASRLPFERAVRYGRILGSMPFVRMVAITGSLAMLNLSKSADMDYMLVTQSVRLWTARAFAVLFGRMMRPLGNKICVNLLVSENALAWPRHDLYSAHETCQMIPVTGMDVYRRLRAANAWTESVLPNSTLEPNALPLKMWERVPAIQKFLELPLRGGYGDRLEQWAMKFQLHRISHQSGESDETNFSVDVCQGNFHHHRHWAGKFFHERLVSLGLVDGPRGYS